MPKKNEIQLGRAKSMRSEQTGPEQHLWYHLRAKRLNGIKFSRQVLVGPYTVDFAARMHGLAIELDGDSHGLQSEYDKQRTKFLESEGFRVIRFSNNDVMGNMEGVLQMIVAAMADSPSPRPSPQRGEGE
jgi:very-short-patch-repair endonuclease